MFIILVVCSIFLLVSFVFLFIRLYFQSNGKVLPAKVVAVERYASTDSEGGQQTYYRPLLEYVFKGQTYRFTSNYGQGNIAWNIGDRVQVYSLNKGPEYVRLKNSASWIFTTMFGLFGIGGYVFYYYQTENLMLLSWFTAATMAIPFIVLNKIKSKKWAQKIWDKILASNLEDAESIKGRNIYFSRGQLEAVKGRHWIIAFFITLIFAGGLSFLTTFLYERVTDRSLEYLERLKGDPALIAEILQYKNDEAFIGMIIAGAFSGLMIYSLIYQLLKKK